MHRCLCMLSLLRRSESMHPKCWDCPRRKAILGPRRIQEGRPVCFGLSSPRGLECWRLTASNMVPRGHSEMMQRTMCDPVAKAHSTNRTSTPVTKAPTRELYLARTKRAALQTKLEHMLIEKKNLMTMGREPRAHDCYEHHAKTKTQ
jgi:hypothetical protein